MAQYALLENSFYMNAHISGLVLQTKYQCMVVMCFRLSIKNKQISLEYKQVNLLI